MNHLSAILLQVADSSSLLVTTLIILAIAIGVFLIIRSLMLWYWKVDVIVHNQELQIQNAVEQLRRDAKIRYYSYLAMEDKIRAYEQLLYIFHFDLSDPAINSKDKQALYESLRPKFSKLFDELGYSYPPSPYAG